MLFLPFLLLPAAAMVHFYADAGARRCFYKDLDRGTLLIGRYKMEITHSTIDSDFYTPQDGINTGVLIDVEETFDNNHRVVHQRGSYLGQFTFSALDAGEHRVCITPKSYFKKKWLEDQDPTALHDSKFKLARVTVDFVIGDGNSVDLKHTHKVRSLQERVNRLNDKLLDIRREQTAIREKEALFRDLLERTCDTVVRWLAIQTGALVLVCIYQMVVLRRFFVKQKVS